MRHKMVVLVLGYALGSMTMPCLDCQLQIWDMLCGLLRKPEVRVIQ